MDCIAGFPTRKTSVDALRMSFLRVRQGNFSCSCARLREGKSGLRIFLAGCVELGSIRMWPLVCITVWQRSSEPSLQTQPYLARIDVASHWIKHVEAYAAAKPKTNGRTQGGQGLELELRMAGQVGGNKQSVPSRNMSRLKRLLR